MKLRFNYAGIQRVDVVGIWRVVWVNLCKVILVFERIGAEIFWYVKCLDMVSYGKCTFVFLDFWRIIKMIWKLRGYEPMLMKLRAKMIMKFIWKLKWGLCKVQTKVMKNATKDIQRFWILKKNIWKILIKECNLIRMSNGSWPRKKDQKD